MLVALLNELALLRRWGGTQVSVLLGSQQWLVYYVAPSGRQMDVIITGGEKPVCWHQYATVKITRTSYRRLKKKRYRLSETADGIALLPLRG